MTLIDILLVIILAALLFGIFSHVEIAKAGKPKHYTVQVNEGVGVSDG